MGGWGWGRTVVVVGVGCGRGGGMGGGGCGGCGGGGLRGETISLGSGSLELGLEPSYLIVEGLLFDGAAHLKALRMVVREA